MTVAIDSQQLRIELKEWEHQFLTAHGRKPERADIKANREMVAKYKLYDKLTRKPQAKPRSDNQSSSPTGSKRKRDSGVGFIEEELQATPTKASRTSSSLREASSDPYDPPLNEFFSPMAAQRTFIGPTPQKNGKVLGLFDLLSPESAQKQTVRKQETPCRVTSQTPSKSRNVDLIHSTPSRSQRGSAAATPSKRTASGPSILTPSRSRANEQQRQQQTQGSGPKTDKFATPSMQRVKTLNLDLDATPEFLKRRHSPAYRPSASTGLGNSATGAEAGTVEGMMNIAWSPVAARRPRKPVGRSFSEILGDNRRAEEERIQLELDILRDFERDTDDDEAGRLPKRTLERSQSAMQPPRVGANMMLGRDLEDANDALLGPDGDRQVDRSDDELDEAASQAAGARAQTGRWRRKKGPKRQTRRVNIRPTQAKWKPEPEWKAGMDSESEGEAIPETQLERKPAAEVDVDDLASEYEDAPKLSAKKSTSGSIKKKPLAKQTGSAKTRTVKASAHANYRSLKIKNKNSKAKRGGRFGRRKGF